MILSTHNNLKAARKAALLASEEYMGQYITLFSCFNLEVVVNKRLNIHAPGDSYGSSYWLNCKEHKFTDKQVIADQNATPVLH